MATKLKGKSPKSLLGDDDLLESLFSDEKQPVKGKGNRAGQLARSTASNNIFSMLAEEVKRDGGDSEDSDVSAADPSDILKNMKDMDDMDADLFSSKKKPTSASVQAKTFSDEGTKKDTSKQESDVKPEKADEPTTAGKKPNSAPASTVQNYKKFNFSDSDGDHEGQTHTKDLDDPLGDFLDDLLPDETKPKSSTQREKPGKAEPSPSASVKQKTETSKAAKNRSDLSFDEQDDLMDALGFDSDKTKPKTKEAALWSNNEKSEPPQRARTRLDEILESLTSPQLLERPPTGERRERSQPQEKQQPEKSAVKETFPEDDVTFGSYQPTLVSTPEGRQSRRQSVRFSTEDISPSTPEKKPSFTATSSRQRSSADWLGLKTNDDLTFLDSDANETKTPESSKAPPSPSLDRRPSLTSSHTAPTVKTAADTAASSDNVPKQTKPGASKTQTKDEEEDDWLAGALSRKKTQSVTSSEAKKSKQEESLGLGEEVDLESVVSKQVPLQGPRSREDTLASVKDTSDSFLGQHSPAAHSTPVSEKRTVQGTVALPVSAAPVIHTQPHPQPNHLLSHKEPRVLQRPSQTSDEASTLLNTTATMMPGSAWTFPPQNQMQNTSSSVQQQVTLPADSLQQLLLQQQMMQSPLLGMGSTLDAGVLQRIKEKEQQHGDYQALQARIIQLEGQVKTLQLERDQSQMLLENIQQRHKQDMELVENAHKARVRLLEESAAQRETQTRQECEDLMERLAAVTRSAERERSELQAQYQRKLSQSQQDRDREVERLRDLQRKSILEMKKDHEDQVHRLKKLKDEEIDAVTSATSQTRSLATVIEQMEQFSSRLGDLSSRVESTHEHTAHGLEQGARHRDEQLRMMQDRLAQQQKAMAEERTYLKEIISRMDTQLNEQQRQLEKERWKMSAEQAKAESTQRGLEEERRTLSVQITMEREELERAKNALMEEQKSVMQHCTEERRKLAAEWANFHTVEKQRYERAEREVSSLLEKREGSIISLAQEQAELKHHTAELKQKEMAVAQEKVALERLREELDREKEQLSSMALRLKTRTQEVEAFSKLAAEKHVEGERALQEAKRVEVEHEARLKNIHIQTERLRQQEQRILQDRLRLNGLQKQTEMLRKDAPVTSLPQMTSAFLPDAGPVVPESGMTSNLNTDMSSAFANSQSMALQASLALWRYTAEKDHEYLQEQQIFLDSLKKKSYRSSFNTD